MQDVEDAIDNLFNHPNVGPFIARRLIQHMVTSNPSPGYIARVATAFNDNGRWCQGGYARSCKSDPAQTTKRARATLLNSLNMGSCVSHFVRYAHFSSALDLEQYYGQVPECGLWIHGKYDPDPVGPRQAYLTSSCPNHQHRWRLY